DNHRMLWIPGGFAHGFLALTDDVDLTYKCTDFYAARHERTIVWNDPELAIVWPLEAGVAPLVSAKDAAGASFASADLFACRCCFSDLVASWAPPYRRRSRAGWTWSCGIIPNL